MTHLIRTVFAVVLCTLAGYAQAQTGVVKASPVAPSEVGETLYDNWNRSGCRLTNTIRFRLNKTTGIGLARTWIKWPAGVSEIEFILQKDNQPLVVGAFGRRNCDPYQQSWCEGVSTWNAQLPAGDYVLTTGLAKVCQNSASASNGFLSLNAPVRRPAVPPPAPPIDAKNAAAPGFTIGDFSQRKGPFYRTESPSTVADFTSDAATTQGIVQLLPSGYVNVSGNAPPGDVDVALVAFGQTADVTITLRPCSSDARVRLFDLQGKMLGQTQDFGSGYYGLYSQFKIPGLPKGAYILVADYPGDAACDDGSFGWVADVSGPVIDPAEFVGSGEPKSPDHSIDETLDVSDLVSDLENILRTGR